MTSRVSHTVSHGPPDPIRERGYQFNDWTQCNPTAEQVKAERAASAERQRRAREKAAQKRAGANSHAVTNAVTNAVSHGEVTDDVTRESHRESRSPRPDPRTRLPIQRLDAVQSHRGAGQSRARCQR